MDKNFFDAAEMEDLFKEMEESQVGVEEQEDKEMSASRRRYLEIIKKHQEEN